LTSADIALLRDEVFAPLLAMEVDSLQASVRAQRDRVRQWVAAH